MAFNDTFPRPDREPQVLAREAAVAAGAGRVAVPTGLQLMETVEVLNPLGGCIAAHAAELFATSPGDVPPWQVPTYE